MDNIVYDFAKITFQPKEVGLTENRHSWRVKELTMTDMEMMRSTSVHGASGAGGTESEDDVSSESNASDDVDSQLSRGEDNDDDSDSISGGSFRSSHHGGGSRSGVSRRRMPSRVSKDNFNRVCSVIMKPAKKKQRKELNTNAQTLRSIEKLYTNKRLKKFTPANLETIFEEPSDENAADAEDDSEECSISSQVRIVKFGGRKLRRAISFSDGLNKNKMLMKKKIRRQKVKKTFGKHFALKKITMTEFHDRLNKSFDSAMLEEGEDEQPGDAAELPKTAMTMEDIQLPPGGQLLLPMQPTAFK
ncbi:hypothetical protein KR054_003813 [Drosophila jambulina]|nr:hypothetical protein KR054_003813 [Drosophila jambulina]